MKIVEFEPVLVLLVSVCGISYSRENAGAPDWYIGDEQYPYSKIQPSPSAYYAVNTPQIVATDYIFPPNDNQYYSQFASRVQDYYLKATETVFRKNCDGCAHSLPAYVADVPKVMATDYILPPYKPGHNLPDEYATKGWKYFYERYYNKRPEYIEDWFKDDVKIPKSLPCKEGMSSSESIELDFTSIITGSSQLPSSLATDISTTAFITQIPDSTFTLTEEPTHSVITRATSFPSITPVIEGTTELTASITPVIEVTTELTASMTPAIVRTTELTANNTPAIDRTTELTASMTPAIEGTTELTANMTPVIEGTTELTASMTPVKDRTTELTVSMTPVIDGTTELTASLSQVIEETTELTASMTPVIDGTTEPKASMTPVIDGTKASLTPVIDGTTELTTSMTPVIGGTTDFTASLTPVIDGTTELTASMTVISISETISLSTVTIQSYITSTVTFATSSSMIPSTDNSSATPTLTSSTESLDNSTNPTNTNATDQQAAGEEASSSAVTAAAVGASVGAVVVVVITVGVVIKVVVVKVSGVSVAAAAQVSAATTGSACTSGQSASTALAKVDVNLPTSANLNNTPLDTLNGNFPTSQQNAPPQFNYVSEPAAAQPIY